MGFLDDMAKKVGTVAGEAGNKAKDVAGIAKLSAEIGSKERDIDKLFIEIGKKVYTDYKDILPDEIKEMFGKIDAIKAEIDRLNDKIKEIKDN
ncbi:MAG: hypothetical protein PUD43_01470 [Clostridia bacterium]|nr:hypothetical protein [Clostridia bacterium]